MIDMVATIVLFIVAFSGVITIPVLVLTSAMLSDSGMPGVARHGVMVAMIGIPVAMLGVLAIAVVWASLSDGVTFYIPLVAMTGQTAAVLAVYTFAMWLVRRGFRSAEAALQR